jgi:hypothetical protein
MTNMLFINSANGTLVTAFIPNECKSSLIDSGWKRMHPVGAAD